MKTIAILASLAAVAATTLPECTTANLAGLGALLANATGPLPPCAKAIHIDAAKLADPMWHPADETVLEAFHKAPECKTYITALAAELKKVNPPCNLAKGMEVSTAAVGAMSFEDFITASKALLTASTTKPASDATTKPASDATTAPAKPATSAPTTAAPTTKPSSAMATSGVAALALTMTVAALM
ncbi:hypothetical protein SDRG_11069 [Saprolegnia diclina VS20]|uniref:Elicitin n=1 Tax=Saprolegnia diclina (strain VS20) TaxID=1156394 RepID=T0RND9_SAPDV|nr:hypothetical protein SDRG_11069 [Saprolegnia diclina VS20]EQC31472.1 hypothetical protein SDRG_11069 [Saprolegnia diclina VS20]|eukprot:XP_008615313.1 hypothetical protein SDRG_11069 [Saprolegnia diclina VS20]